MLPGRDRPQNEAQFSVVLGPQDPRFLRHSCRGRRPEEETLRLGAWGEAPARSACPGSPERGQDLRVWDGAVGPVCQPRQGRRRSSRPAARGNAGSVVP